MADQHPLSSLGCMLVRHRADPCPANCSSPPRTKMREASVVRATCVFASKNPHLQVAEFELSYYEQTSKNFLQIPVFASSILAHLCRNRSHSSPPPGIFHPPPKPDSSMVLERTAYENDPRSPYLASAVRWLWRRSGTGTGLSMRSNRQVCNPDWFMPGRPS